MKIIILLNLVIVIFYFIQREYAFYPPIDNLTLKIGDIIVLGATRKSLEEAISKLGDQLQPQLTKELNDNILEINKKFN